MIAGGGKGEGTTVGCGAGEADDAVSQGGEGDESEDDAWDCEDDGQLEGCVVAEGVVEG